MSKISSMLDVGKRSLTNSGTALQTVSHNIANKSTEGFSRQRVELQTAVPITDGKLQIGMGAKTMQVTRTNNPWLEKQIGREQSNLGQQEAKADSLSRVEQVYNEQVNKGLNQYMTDFFNSVREASNNPESLASRTSVREAGVALVNDFKRVNGQLRDIQKDVDNQVRSTVEEVNQIAKEIASLNEKIQLVELQGSPANDERDRRDLLVKQLGERIDITWAEGKEGMVSITAAKTGALVSGISHNELRAFDSANGDRVEVYFKNMDSGTTHNISSQVTGGRLGGAMEVRDKHIEGLLSSMDQLAHTFASEVNQAHIEGFDRSGRPGVEFFKISDGVEGASANLDVSNEIINDVGRIALASRPNAPGDNIIGNVISALQYQRTMDGKSSSFDDYYNAQVGQIGTIAQRATKSHEAQKNMVSQLSNIRESISGVSLDEETTKMVEFQRAYEASARLIRTADEMMETVLNLKRL